MLFVIDVGNTNFVLGLFRGDNLIKSWRMSTVESRTSDEMGIYIHSLLAHSGFTPAHIENCIISSVVPNIMHSLLNGIRKYFEIEPIICHRDMRLGISLNQVGYRELGADRIVNCVAGYRLFGGPIIIIDYGTATTYDAVNAQGEFITGITAPGIKISAEALFSRAALLGKVELVFPASPIVNSTAASMQAGIMYSAVGETEYIVTKLRNELGQNAKIIATGGLARTIAAHSKVFDHIRPDLTLEGLRILHELNT